MMLLGMMLLGRGGHDVVRDDVREGGGHEVVMEGAMGAGVGHDVVRGWGGGHDVAGGLLAGPRLLTAPVGG